MNDLVLPNAAVLLGDCVERMKGLPAGSAQMCVTSPPYFGLRDYGMKPVEWPDISYQTLGGIVHVPAMACCLGSESTPEAFIGHMVLVFREARRVLRDDGTLWLNIGDSYSSHKGQSQGVDPKSGARRFGLRPNDKPMLGFKHKDLIGIPWMLAFALRADGWHLRQDIIWNKPNAMPEPVRDRCTKAHEYLFLLSKSARYYFDSDAMKEPAVQAGRVRNDRMGGNKYVEGVKHSDGGMFTGSDTRNRRSVWTVTTRPYKGAHFATFPPGLIEPCILAGSGLGDIVLDPFNGSGTTGQAALQHGRRYVGIELNPEYVELTRQRLAPSLPAGPEPELLSQQS